MTQAITPSNSQAASAGADSSAREIPTAAAAGRPVTEITVCDTCKYPDGESSRDGLPAGPALLSALETALAKLAPADRARLRLRRFSCLMNCSRACSAAVAAHGSGKVGYVLGDFEPGAEAAEALIGYALGHAASETGVVPYKTWPQGVKGHFVARIPGPPAPEEAEAPAAPKLD